MPNSVHIRGLTKRFGEHTVLSGIDLEVTAGETVTLIGPSGSGKSTLLRCLNGLVHFDAGEIQVGAHQLVPGDGPKNHDAAHRIRLTFGMIFQDFQLFPHLTALENCMEAPVRVLGLPAAEARARSEALLARVGLAEKRNHYPSRLSGGQKQRVAIARALAMQPRGLLCDEITSALDPELKHEVLEVIEDLKRDNLTIILVTHEIGFARRAADRVVVLADGGIVESGTPADVIDRPQMPRTKQFLERVMA
jgi:polar amino acid transport system ATP-binding protein